MSPISVTDRERGAEKDFCCASSSEEDHGFEETMLAVSASQGDSLDTSVSTGCVATVDNYGVSSVPCPQGQRCFDAVQDFFPCPATDRSSHSGSRRPRPCPLSLCVHAQSVSVTDRGVWTAREADNDSSRTATSVMDTGKKEHPSPERLIADRFAHIEVGTCDNTTDSCDDGRVSSSRVSRSSEEGLALLDDPSPSSLELLPQEIEPQEKLGRGLIFTMGSTSSCLACPSILSPPVSLTGGSSLASAQNSALHSCRSLQSFSLESAVYPVQNPLPGPSSRAASRPAPSCVSRSASNGTSRCAPMPDPGNVSQHVDGSRGSLQPQYLPADPRFSASSALCSKVPERTPSNSSTDSLDSGVWSLSPVPSPTLCLFPVSDTTPSPLPRSDASMQLVDTVPLMSHMSADAVSWMSSSVQLSENTLRLAATARHVENVFPTLRMSASSQSADTASLMPQLPTSVQPSNQPADHLMPPMPASTHPADTLPPLPMPQLLTADPMPQTPSSRQPSRSNTSSAMCARDLDRLARSMQNLEDACIYYPHLDSDGARALLLEAPLGSYLVRDSSDPRFLFAITLKTERGPTSVRVRYSKGLFQMDCEEGMKRALPRFETMLDLLDFHTTLSRQGNQYRWLEASRRRDLLVRFSAPHRHSPPALTHQARVTVNRSLEDLHLPARSTDLLPVPAAIKQFLRCYPYRV